MTKAYYIYEHRLKRFARQNRRAMTPAEGLLWHCVLKGKRTGRIRIRQKPIDRYILDFYCAACKLCIEVDGDIHEYQQVYDTKRDDHLFKNYHIRTIRYTNAEILSDLQAVSDSIMHWCEGSGNG